MEGNLGVARGLLCCCASKEKENFNPLYCIIIVKKQLNFIITLTSIPGKQPPSRSSFIYHTASCTIMRTTAAFTWAGLCFWPIMSLSLLENQDGTSAPLIRWSAAAAWLLRFEAERQSDCQRITGLQTLVWIGFLPWCSESLTMMSTWWTCDWLAVLPSLVFTQESWCDKCPVSSWFVQQVEQCWAQCGCDCVRQGAKAFFRTAKRICPLVLSILG